MDFTLHFIHSNNVLYNGEKHGGIRERHIKAGLYNGETGDRISDRHKGWVNYDVGNWDKMDDRHTNKHIISNGLCYIYDEMSYNTGEMDGES